ncbi:hypothetical protein [uncultured Kordia sp.]|uniref:hypothetical protein n=1 Tax=uncultured Kordia sp. TaxID=507699 RepID=UPI002601BFC6|nr:hypothetical protein [uncultured Kordia sp.]
MGNFYKMNEKIQWLVGIVMILILVLVIVGWLSVENMLLRLSLIFIVIPIYVFLTSPIMTLTKKYKYVSPMLLYIDKKNAILELHSGTSFDYISIMKNIRPGMYWRNKMLQYYINGLSVIVKKIKNGDIAKNTTIKGTSHFMENSIIKKLGFTTVDPEPIDKVIFVLDYLDLIWMNSFSRGKIHFPKFSSLKKAEILAEELLNSENELKKYQEFLKNKAGD